MKKISKLLACSVIALVSTITDHSRDLSMDLLKASAEEVDVFEIHEVNQESIFFDTIMKERMLVA